MGKIVVVQLNEEDLGKAFMVSQTFRFHPFINSLLERNILCIISLSLGFKNNFVCILGFCVLPPPPKTSVLGLLWGVYPVLLYEAGDVQKS